MATHDEKRKTTDAEALAWIRRKLKLPEGTPMFEGGGQTIAGELHVVCAGHHGYETYIKTFKCEDKDGQIARLTVEVEELRRMLSVRAVVGDTGAAAEPTAT